MVDAMVWDRIGLFVKHFLYADEQDEKDYKAALKVVEEYRKTTAHPCRCCMGEGGRFVFKKIRVTGDGHKDDYSEPVIKSIKVKGLPYYLIRLRWCRDVPKAWEVCTMCDGVGRLCNYCSKGKKECGCG